MHTRQVSCRGYQLDDGCWEIEGRMVDLKTFPMKSPAQDGQIEVGEPLHDMTLSLVIDGSMKIRQVCAEIEAAPFKQCASISGAFRDLEGLCLAPGFLGKARELLGGVNGCTHLLELLGPIATTAYQTLWQGENGYNADDPDVAEMLLDSCHTLARNGVVANLLAAELSGLVPPQPYDESLEDSI